MAKNRNLNAARIAKNDEFYTLFADIDEELAHYRAHFKDKVIYCNCDDPAYSNFWRYFHLNFESLGLKKLIATHYDAVVPTYMMEYTGGSDEDVSVGERIPLSQNGDFRSSECLALLDKSDIVVTNGPFSLFRSFVSILIEHHKKFLVIGNMNCITYKEFFPLIKDNKVWLGYNSPKMFRMPDGEIKKFGNIKWFTNLDHQKRHTPIPLVRSYAAEPERFPEYDNFSAINVDKACDIPADYMGVMGVPVSFLEKYCPKQFEILWTQTAAETDIWTV